VAYNPLAGCGGSVVPPCPPGTRILLCDSACRCRRVDARLAHFQKSDIYLIYRWSQAGGEILTVEMPRGQGAGPPWSPACLSSWPVIGRPSPSSTAARSASDGRVACPETSAPAGERAGEQAREAARLRAASAARCCSASTRPSTTRSRAERPTSCAAPAPVSSSCSGVPSPRPAGCPATSAA